MSVVESHTDVVLDALDDLCRSVPDLRGALVASVDGLPVASRLRGGSPESVAAMAATTAGLGGRLADDFALGPLAECVVRADQGYFIVYRAGVSAVLAVTAAEGANLGRIHLAARRCARTVADAQHPNPNPEGGHDAQER